MTKWLFGAITFGIFAMLFAIGSLISSHAIFDQWVPFIGGPTGRSGFPSTDLTGAMAFAALISASLCLGSIAKAVRGRKKMKLAGDDDINSDSDAPAWTCPHCHEKNAGNFDECWKCQRNRPEGAAR